MISITILKYMFPSPFICLLIICIGMEIVMRLISGLYKRNKNFLLIENIVIPDRNTFGLVVLQNGMESKASCKVRPYLSNLIASCCNTDQIGTFLEAEYPASHGKSS